MEGLAIMQLQQAGFRRQDGHLPTLEKLKQDHPGVDEALLQDILRGCVGAAMSACSVMCVCARQCVRVFHNVYVRSVMCACAPLCVHVLRNVCVCSAVCACAQQCLRAIGNV